MIRSRLSLAVATLSCALLAAGCGSSSEISDDALDDSVSQRLRAEPELATFDLDVEVDEGMVTLDGSVAAESQRMAAERIARSTAGVKGVSNQIDLGESPPAVGAPPPPPPGSPPAEVD